MQYATLTILVKEVESRRIIVLCLLLYEFDTIILKSRIPLMRIQQATIMIDNIYICSIACVYLCNYIFVELAVVSGWGTVSMEGGMAHHPDTLRTLEVTILTRTECADPKRFPADRIISEKSLNKLFW